MPAAGGGARPGGWYAAASTVALSRLSGRLSRLLPNSDEGASARIEASVSSELRRRRFDDDASVRTDALSVSMLLDTAELYVYSCGRCEADVTLWFGAAGAGFPAGAAAVAAGARIPDGAVDWRVVRVVVRDSCECCGDENVLFPLPSRELKPPPPVCAVPVFECAASE